MYIPIKIEAKNFQSFESLDYFFQQKKAVLVQGENLTDEGQSSNGSGKSTIEEIPYYCLLGTSSTGKRDIKLISWWDTEAFIAFELSNPYLNTVLRIERRLFAKKSSTLKIFINGVDQKDKFATVPEGNKLILRLLEISAEDLRNYYLINREKFVSFFSSSDTDKRNLISRFSNVGYILNAESVLLKEIVSLQTKLQEKNNNLIALGATTEVYKKQIDKAIEEDSDEFFNSQKLKNLELKKTERDEHEQLKVEIKEEIEKTETSLLQSTFIHNCYQKAIDKIQKFDYTQTLLGYDKNITNTEQELKSQKQTLSSIETEVTTLTTEIAPIEIALGGLLTCPKCSFEFIPHEEIDPTEARELVQLTVKEVEALRERVKTQDLSITEVEKKIRNLRLEKGIIERQSIKRDSLVRMLRKLILDLSPVIKELQKSLQDSKQLLTLNETSITNLDSEITQLQNLKKTNLELVIKPIQEEIDKISLQIQEESQKITELENQIQEKNSWIINFKNFYIYLTNKSLSVIQGYSNAFLQKINTHLQIKFEGFKTLADKSIKENITAIVLNNGIEEDDYRSFSGGERGKLVFSTILAFQHLINLNCPSGGLDFLFIDEILDSVDGTGMRNFITALNNLDKTILLTSHITTKEVDENTLLIKKINGKSYLN